MSPRVQMTVAARDALLQAAATAAPREAVGLLGGDEHDGAVHVTSFVAVPQHAAAADAFVVPAPAFATAEAALRARGERWLGFAHSHPHGSAMPSLRDRRELWSGCVHVIVAAAAAPAWCAFRLRDGAVLPLPLEVV